MNVNAHALDSTDTSLMEEERSLTVVVTGGAIDAGFDFNSSGMIRDSLPSFIHRPGRPSIELLIYPRGTACSYEATGALIPTLWKGNRDLFGLTSVEGRRTNIDLMLHMGMRTSSNAFCLETQARKHCFSDPGEDGKYLHQTSQAESGDWDNLPGTLSPSFNIQAIVDQVAGKLPDIPVEASSNAGGYFCEFELYSSLAELYKRGERARVVFLHTPAKKEERDIQNGVKVVLELVCALLDSVDG